MHPTTETAKPPVRWQSPADQYWAARDTLKKYAGQGIFFELNDDQNGFAAFSRLLDDQGEFVPIPPATLDQIAADRELILRGLRNERFSLKQITAAWWEHDPEYREYCQEVAQREAKR